METLLSLDHMRLEKRGWLALNQAFDLDYEQMFAVYLKLQERARYSQDPGLAGRA